MAKARCSWLKERSSGGSEGVIDAQNPYGQYARSDYDVKRRLSIDAVWDIPGFRNGIAGAITKGWTASPVVILQSGLPFTVYTSGSYPDGDYNADGFGFDVPNVPAFGNHVSSSRSQFIKGIFSASDFPAPAPGVQGNLGRNTYEGPGLANVNFSLRRAFGFPLFGEKASLQIRGEILNLFNRVNLTNPVSDLNSGFFGRSTNRPVRNCQDGSWLRGVIFGSQTRRRKRRHPASAHFRLLWCAPGCLF